MSNNKEIPHCKKCGTPFKWNNSSVPPASSKRAQEGKKGWWAEMTTGENHTEVNCAKYIASGEFANADYMKEQPDRESVGYVPKANIDFTEVEKQTILEVINPSIRELIVIETAIKSEFVKFGIEVVPAHVGLYLKLLQDRRLSQ